MLFHVTSFFLSMSFGLEFRELQYLLCGSPTHITFIQTAEGFFSRKIKMNLRRAEMWFHNKAYPVLRRWAGHSQQCREYWHQCKSVSSWSVLTCTFPVWRLIVWLRCFAGSAIIAHNHIQCNVRRLENWLMIMFLLIRRDFPFWLLLTKWVSWWMARQESD